MNTRRQERMSAEIKKIMSMILLDAIKDPRIDFSAVSVNRVDLSNDLSFARIYFSILADDTRQKEILDALQKAKGYIRTELGKSLKLRHVPELEFKLDKSIEQGFRIAALLDEIKEVEQNRKHEE